MRRDVSKRRVEGRGSKVGPRSTLHAPRSTTAFTLVEILIAIGILGLVLTAIFSSWTAILRASKTGLDSAATVQRARIVMRTLEDSLLCAQSFGGQNQRYYGFIAENGSDASLSFVSRLPESFPRNRKFGDLQVRRVTFSLESGAESSRRLVLRQSPLLMEPDRDENEYPLVLAHYVSEFEMQFWDERTHDWGDEWRQTNQLPKLVKFTLKLADNANSMHRPQQEITRIVSLPAMTVQPAWQMGGGVPGRPQPIPGTQQQPPGGNPNIPQPLVNPRSQIR